MLLVPGVHHTFDAEGMGSAALLFRQH
jgi:hypothetical protein